MKAKQRRRGHKQRCHRHKVGLQKSEVPLPTYLNDDNGNNVRNVVCLATMHVTIEVQQSLIHNIQAERNRRLRKMQLLDKTPISSSQHIDEKPTNHWCGTALAAKSSSSGVEKGIFINHSLVG